jgi:long-chain acyl-CoA synthetase
LEAGTVGVPTQGTGSKTMADLLPLAAGKYPDRPALRHKVGDEWRDVSYAELGEVVREASLGLVDLGIDPGDKVAILAHTRVEWTYACFGILCAGATLVTIYQTNSPEECLYVAGHSESRLIFAEDMEQLAKIRQIRDELPQLEHVVVMDPADTEFGEGEMTLDDLRARGRGRDRSEFEQRYSSVSEEDICLYIYTSGTTGPPKGCLLSHANYRAITNSVNEVTVLEGGDCTYLFLPLAHAFAILVLFASLDLGVTVAFWSRDPQKVVPELTEVNPTYFPSVPRMFEKIYTLATSQAPVKERLQRTIEVGVQARQLIQRGEDLPEELGKEFQQAEQGFFKHVRSLFGQNIRECVTGAAPIAHEILEFFYACGVPVMEGYGMTETATSATVNRVDDFRFGSVGKAAPGVELRIADDGEVLIKGPNIFKGYYKNEEASKEALEDGWLHTGDLGRLDEDGFLYITGRKKDIIITAGGKNITPANLENGLKQNRWISQALVVGDRKPYLAAIITLDAEEAPAFAQELGSESDPEQLPGDERVQAEIQKAVDQVNSQVGPVEQIKRFEILSRDFSMEGGELTPTLKVKRNVVHEKYADTIESIYARPR